MIKTKNKRIKYIIWFVLILLIVIILSFLKPEQPEPIKYTDDEVISIMKNFLENEHELTIGLIEIQNKERINDDKTLFLSYSSDFYTDQDLEKQRGVILASFLELSKGWDIDKLSVIGGGSKGQIVSMWGCEKQWKEDFINGKMGFSEIMEKSIYSVDIFDVIL